MASVTEAREELEKGYVELLWRRAAKDPLFFMEECIMIPSQVDPRGREEFELFDYQKDDLHTFLSERFAIVLKSRQIGLSTLVGAYALWMALFRPGAVILWVSNSLDNANKAVAMLDVMWNYLPAWARDRAPKLTGDQAGKKEWTFEDGMTSRIRAFAGTAKAGASETASLVVLDEFALVDDQDNLLRSADPTTDAGGSLFIISTARGAYNRFATTFRAAQRGVSKFKPVFHPWMVSRFTNPLAHLVKDCATCNGQGILASTENGYCPDCVDLSRYEVKAREFADQPWLTAAEYPRDPEEAFRESGRPRFPNLPPLEDCDNEWFRGELEAQADDRLVFVPDEEGPLRLSTAHLGGGDAWREYVLFVDPSTGTGGDAIAAQVVCYDEDGEPERVAWWHDNTIEPVDVAYRMDKLGRYFAGSQNGALLAVETTGGWGASMLSELQNHIRYTNLYAHRLVGHRRRTTPTKLGFPLSMANRPLVIDRLAEYVSTKDGGPRLGGIDPMLRYELGTFVRREDGKIAADVGCHDDLVMSMAGALWILLENVVATERPDREEPQPVEWRCDLSDMFEGIEEVRRMEAEQARRAERRNSMRRAMRRR